MRREPNADRLIVKLSLFLIGIGAAAMLLIKPVIVGGLIDSFGYSPREAGLVAGIEMAGVGVGTLIVVAFGGAWNGRWIAATGAAIGIAACLGPALWSGFPIVMAFRFCAGVGSGVLVSVVIAAIATTHDPDRWFSLYYMASALAAVALFPLGSAVVVVYGVRAAYFLLAILLLPAFLLLPMVPTHRARRWAEGNDAMAFPLGPAAISLSASVIYWIGTGAVWAFIERIGISDGLPEVRIGSILATSQVTLVLGALSASLLHTRIGRAIPAVSGVLLSLAALAILRFAGSETGFVGGVLLFTFAWMLFFPYLTGTMAAQDQAGRVAVLGVPSQTLGLAIGPSIAGYLASGSDYGAVILLGAAAHAVAIIVLLPALLTSYAPGVKAAEA